MRLAPAKSTSLSGLDEEDNDITHLCVCVFVCMCVCICVYVGVQMFSVYVFAALWDIFSQWRALLVSYFMFLLWHHQFSTVAISGHYR